MNSIKKVVLHRNKTISVLQSQFDGMSQEEFLKHVTSQIPDTYRVEKVASQLYNGGGDANKGGWTATQVGIRLSAPESASILAKHLRQVNHI